jgi:hypothetical protein
MSTQTAEKVVRNPYALKILKGQDKRVTSYGDTRYSDGKHTDWAQKK